MRLPISSQSYVVFDLDDTLYPEIDFVSSGFHHIAKLACRDEASTVAASMMERFRAGAEVLNWVRDTYSLGDEWSLSRLVDEYRYHVPSLNLPTATERFLRSLDNEGVPMGLVTDGRAISQRNKLRALGLEGRFADIIISEEFGSEKPDPANFEIFARRHPGARFILIGDNTAKDFQVPAQMGWTTICLKCAGHNIHAQDFSREAGPQYLVSSLDEIELVREEIVSQSGSAE